MDARPPHTPQDPAQPETPVAPAAGELETVRRIARLAGLEVAEAEEAALARDFAAALEAFRTLAELELGAEPERPAVDTLRLRADEPRASLGAERLLPLAPEREGPFYRVPKTVGGEP